MSNAGMLVTPWSELLPPPWMSVIDLAELWAELDELYPRLERRVLEKINLGIEYRCWVWVGYCHVQTHYGHIYDSELRRPVQAHRYVWERLIGPIGEGVTLDHRCRNRACCWPGHLKPKSGGDNTRAAALDRYHMRQPTLSPELNIPRLGN